MASRGPRILVLDPDTSQRRVASRGLAERGFQVEAPERTEKAAERLSKGTYGILIVDRDVLGADWSDAVSQLKQRAPQTEIIVTAKQGSIEAAVEAMREGAYDYLLKPFDRPRFQKALNRAKEYIHLKKNGGFNDRLREFLQEIKSESQYVDRLIIKSEGRIFFLKSSEIDWIEAAGNYVTIHTGNEAYTQRETMGGLEKKLDPQKFMRIHRSKIVNIDRIKEMKPWFRGEYVIVLKDDTELTLSRKYREKLKALFNHSF